MKDTIFALATAQGKAGIAVVRISGPAALGAACVMAGDLPVPGRVLRNVRDGSGDLIDQALVLTFEDGASFTGETVVEFHLHGSTVIVAAVLNELAIMQDLRQAEPGEFTRRALENGNLDLAQVEGLADLIDAETEAQRKQAVRVFSGAMGEVVDGWRQKLIRAAALIEATIDFADEDVPVDVWPEALELIGEVRSDLEREVAGFSAAERIRSGFEVAIVGPPNVGKSTLLNRLAGRSAAITSEFAGTTRDVIEVHMDIAGLPVTLLDTAGLRETDDQVENIGIQRGRDRAKLADLRVYLIDNKGDIPDIERDEDIVLWSKSDLTGSVEGSVSGKTGEGVDDLLKEIGSRLTSQSAAAGLAIRSRHRTAMRSGIAALLRVEMSDSIRDDAVDFLAEDVRQALRSIDSLVGRIDVEDVLGEIFSSFCIGK